MNRIPELAIRFRTITLFVTTVLMAWGVIAYLTMPRREDPEFTIRTCTVQTRWPGVATEKVEQLITDPLEEAISRIEEVDIVRSTTTLGQSAIFVDLDDNLNADEIDQIWDIVRAEVEKVEMPDSSIRPTVDSNFGDTSILLLGVYQQPLPGESEVRQRLKYRPRQLEIYAEQIKDQLRLLDGVASVELFGVRKEAIYIETDLGNWSELDLTIDSLQSLISARNISDTGGTVDTEQGRFSVEPSGELDAVSEINNIVVGLATSDNSSNQVYLKDLGLNVNRDYQDPPPLICRFSDSENSYPAIMIGLTMADGQNIIDVNDRAKLRVDQMINVEQVLPGDLAVTPVSDQSENVSLKIDDVIGNVIGAVVIVVIVVYLFVGFRSAVVMAANIPVVVLASLGIVFLFGVQLEQISLASIIIALGLLVDNAVQVCDQSRTNQLLGMAPKKATVFGAKTLAMPILSGTATTIAAFLPMLFMLGGGGREYIFSLPVTVSTTLAISWVIAMSFCVILATYFIRVPKSGKESLAPLPFLYSMMARIFGGRAKKQEDKSDKSNGERNQNLFMLIYGQFANIAIKAKFLTLLIAIGLLVLTLQLPVGSEFFPQDDRDQFVVEVWLPESASIDQTNQVALDVEKLIRTLGKTTDENGEEVNQIRAMRTMVGGGGARWHLGWSPESRKPNYAEILIRTNDAKFTPELASRIRDAAEHGNAELQIEPIVRARVVPKQMGLGPPAKPVEIRVIGNGAADIATLRPIAEQIKGLVADQPETWNIFDTWGINSYQLKIDIDSDKASLAGVSNSQVAQTLSAYYSGRELTTFREGEHTVPVYFRLKPGQRDSLTELSQAFVEGNSGKIPLNSIAKIETVWQPARIDRRDMNRAIEVRSEVEPGVQGNDVVNRIMNSVEMKQIQNKLPPGFNIEVGGSLEESADASSQFLASFGVSFLLIVLILVIQYNSITKPLIILTTLPLALIGAIPGLYFSDNPLGFMPQLGVISLFGIVLNTGIIFIEFADILIAQKRQSKLDQDIPLDGPIVGLNKSEFRECLIEAGKQRMLPIFLTTATTIGGLLPLALSGGPLWTGLAWAMIAGLTVATLLTLFVVPALYAVLVETFRVQPIAIDTES